MKTNGNEFGFNLFPFYGKVHVEIYRLHKGSEIHLLTKRFGKWWRTPTREDYKKAKHWADCQMSYIRKANETL